MSQVQHSGSWELLVVFANLNLLKIQSLCHIQIKVTPYMVLPRVCPVFGSIHTSFWARAGLRRWKPSPLWLMSHDLKPTSSALNAPYLEPHTYLGAALVFGHTYLQTRTVCSIKECPQKHIKKSPTPLPFILSGWNEKVYHKTRAEYLLGCV